MLLPGPQPAMPAAARQPTVRDTTTMTPTIPPAETGGEDEVNEPPAVDDAQAKKQRQATQRNEWMKTQRANKEYLEKEAAAAKARRAKKKAAAMAAATTMITSTCTAAATASTLVEATTVLVEATTVSSNQQQPVANEISNSRKRKAGAATPLESLG